MTLKKSRKYLITHFSFQKQITERDSLGLIKSFY